MAKTPEQKAAEKKAALVESLSHFNISVKDGTLTGEETSDELADLLKKAKAEAAKGITASKTSVSVQFAGGIREFTKEIHGSDFSDLAGEFAETHNGTVLK